MKLICTPVYMYIVAQRTMMMIEPRCSPTEAQKLPKKRVQKNSYTRKDTENRNKKSKITV